MSRQRPLQLAGWQRRLLYLTLIVLSATGVVWLISQYRLFGALSLSDAAWQTVSAWMMRLHGAACMVALYLSGTLLSPHILPALRGRHNRRTGISLIVGLSILAVSGYGLYYFASDEMHPWWSVTHWVVGVLGIVVLPWHIVRGHRAKSLLRAPHR